MQLTRSERYLQILLRVTALVMLTAIVAVYMPRSWMAYVHERIGLGEFPSAVIAEYLARQTSFLYATLGGLFLLAAADVRRYEHLITYLAIALIINAITTFLFFMHGLPWYGLAGDLISAAGFVAITLALQHRARRERSGIQQ